MPLFCKSIIWSCSVRMVRWVSESAFFFFLLVLTWIEVDKINLTEMCCFVIFLFTFIFMFCDVKIFVFFFLPYSVLATLHSSLFERIPIPFVAD